MIRFVAVRAAQTALLIAAGGFSMIRAPLPPPCGPEPATTFSISVMGENEGVDGSWRGVDLLVSPETPVQRLQLTVRPDRTARVYVDAISPEGTMRLFPQGLQSPLLARGRAYALPGPQTFYELSGSARVRLTVVPIGAEGEVAHPAESVAGLENVGPMTYPLTDGSHAYVFERVFRADGPATVEMALKGP